MSLQAGFLPGAAVGALVALLAVLLTGPATDEAALAAWIELNLGHSSWLFAAVLVLFVAHLHRLRRLLADPREARAVVELDQLTDVWTHVFMGIGVIWTAVGMRAALQVTLADPEQALAASAGAMLRKLVDGGILLALTTTIVGAVGGYLMRLVKTLYTGAALHAFYAAQHNGELRELLGTVQRLERRLAVNGNGSGNHHASA